MKTIQKPPGCSCAIRNNSLDAHISCPILNDAVIEKLSTLIADRLRNKSGVGRISPEKSSVCSLTRHGEGWQMVFNGRPCLLFHRSGMSLLSILLASPKTEYCAFDLMCAINLPPPESLPDENIDPRALMENESHHNYPSNLPLADQETISTIKARFFQNEEEIAFAKQSGSTQIVSELEEEQAAITEYLAQVENIHKLPRVNRGDLDRARRAVGKAIALVITAIRKAGQPELARHLSQSIPHLSGYYISYSPDPPITWEISPMPK